MSSTVTYSPYNPAPTKSFQRSTGLTIDVTTMCTPFEALGLATLLQPLYSSVLKLGVDNGIAPFDFEYDDNDSRRRFFFYSDDGKVQPLFAGPLLELMWKNGIGRPGSWYWRERVEVGGKTPCKQLPRTLDWKENATPPAIPITPAMVVVTAIQSLHLFTGGPTK